MVISSLRSRYFAAVIVAGCLCAVALPGAQAQVANPATHSDIVPIHLAAPAEKLQLPGVHNVGKVSDALFRGGQPSQQGLVELRKLGVSTVVDLRGNRGPVEWERSQVESLGMRFVNIPIGGMSPPSDAQVAQFLKLFRDEPNPRVFVHCYYGSDRTGVMVAAYRIAQQNWTADQAATEMNSFGFHYHWYRGMKSYVRKFPSSFSAESAFAALRTVPTPH